MGVVVVMVVMMSTVMMVTSVMMMSAEIVVAVIVVAVIVMVTPMPGAIRTGFRLEGAHLEGHRQTELAHHAVEDVIMLVGEAA